MTDRLRPLQHSHAVDELEAELKDLFIKLYSDALAATVDDVNVYGAPRLGSFSLVEKNVEQDGLTVLRETTESRIRYVFDAWRNRNPERGLHFLRLYLLALFGDSVTAGQLWQRKDVDYPLALATSEEIDANGGNYDDYFLTSRVRVDIDTDIVQSKLLASLKSATAARILLNVRIGKLLQASLYLAAAGHTVNIMRLGSYGSQESSIDDVLFVGNSLTGRSFVPRTEYAEGFVASESLTIPAGSGVLTVYEGRRVSFTAAGDTEGEIVHAPQGGSIYLKSGTPYWWVNVIASTAALDALESPAGTAVPVDIAAARVDHGFDNRQPSAYAQVYSGQRFRAGAFLESRLDLSSYTLERIDQAFRIDSFGRPQINLPGVVVVSTGAADYAGTGGAGDVAETTKLALTGIRDRILSAGASVVFCSQVVADVVGDMLDFIVEINDHMRQLSAADPSRVRFADFYDLVQGNAAMLDDGAFTPLGAATAGKIIATEMLRFVKNRAGVGAFRLGHEYDNLVINGELAGSAGTKVNISGNVATDVTAEYAGDGVCAASKRLEGGSYPWQVFDIVDATDGDELTAEFDLNEIAAGDVLFSEVGFDVSGAGVKQISHSLEFAGDGKRDTNHSLLEVSESDSLAGAIKGVLRTRNLGAPIWVETATLKLRALMLEGNTEIKIRNVGAAKLMTETVEPAPAVIYDPDAQALFDEFTGTPSEKLKAAINNYILKLKDPARWDSGLGALWYGTHSFCCMQGVNTAQDDRRIDWRHPALKATYSVPANAAGLSAEYGLDRSQIASAPSSEPVFGLPPVNNFDGPYKQNDCAVSMYFTKGENTAGKTGVVLSCSLVNNGMMLVFTTGSTYRMYGFVQSNNNNTLGPNTGGNLPIGGDEVSVSRSGATACRIIQNGVAGAASTTASSATPPGIIAPLMHRPGTTLWSLGTANMAAGRIYVGRHITAAENAMLRQIHNEYLAELAS